MPALLKGRSLHRSPCLYLVFPCLLPSLSPGLSKIQDRPECPNCGVVCTRASSLKRYIFPLVPLSVPYVSVHWSSGLSPGLSKKQYWHECPNCGVVCTRASSLKRYVCPLVPLSVTLCVRPLVLVCPLVCPSTGSPVCPQVSLKCRTGMTVGWFVHVPVLLKGTSVYLSACLSVFFVPLCVRPLFPHWSPYLFPGLSPGLSKKQDQHECLNCGVVCTRASSLKRYVFPLVPLSVPLFVRPLVPRSVPLSLWPNCGVVCTRASSLKR